MEMKWEQVESKWEILTSSAKGTWSKLSDDDLREISGKRERLTMRIQETYGITKREADKQVWDWGRSLGRPETKIA
jgi:uncharacterized protein YjbJ (UPF0337 family)